MSDRLHAEKALDALAIVMYLDWWNNYLTLDRFAEAQGLSLKGAETLIENGRRLYSKQKMSRQTLFTLPRLQILKHKVKREVER